MIAEISNLSDEELEKELIFAEGFAPPVTPEEQEWLEELRAEKERRKP